MLPQLGTICLTLIVPLSLYGVGALLVGWWRVIPAALASGRAAVFAVCGLYGVAAGLLEWAFLTDDFRLTYVAGHSSSHMNIFYKCAGLWGGLDGSLLFWAVLLAAMTWLLVRQLERRVPLLMPVAAAVLLALLWFFGVMLLFAANPFSTALTVPFDGKGLNPLLQAAEMVIHPPSLYVGYVSAAIPFAIMIAAVVNRTTDAWLSVARRWILLCWCFLSIGNLLGMHWAYLELGWGGFWAWDPVENAAIMPWFTATALVHSLMAQQQRRGLPIWNVTLIALTFLLTILGTYLTRSGVVQSVHAFSNSTIGAYFAGLLAVSLVVSVMAIVWHARVIARTAAPALASREGAFLLSNIVLTSGAVAILWGTMLPTLSEAMGLARVTVGPAFFNQMMAPFGLVILVLMGAAPALTWGQVTAAALWALWRIPVTLAAIAVAAAWWLGWHQWFVLSCGAAAMVAGMTALYRLGQLVRQVPTAHSVPAQSSLQRQIGAYIAHTAMVLIMIGIAGAALHTEVDIEAREGDRFALGATEVEFTGLRYRQTDEFEAIGAELIVRRGDDVVATLYPARQFYPGSDQPTTEIGRVVTLWADLYTVLGSFDVDARTVQLKLMHNPLVSWLWIGGILLVLGIIVVMTAGDASRLTGERV